LPGPRFLRKRLPCRLFFGRQRLLSFHPAWADIWRHLWHRNFAVPVSPLRLRRSMRRVEVFSNTTIALLGGFALIAACLRDPVITGPMGQPCGRAERGARACSVGAARIAGSTTHRCLSLSGSGLRTSPLGRTRPSPPPSSLLSIGWVRWAEFQWERDMYIGSSPGRAKS
jgi:hypothetical protein